MMEFNINQLLHAVIFLKCGPQRSSYLGSDSTFRIFSKTIIQLLKQLWKKQNHWMIYAHVLSIILSLRLSTGDCSTMLILMALGFECWIPGNYVRKKTV